MSNTLSIATIQFDVKWEDKQSNFRYVEQQLLSIDKATQLVILPEMFSTGFSMNPSLLAESMEGETVKWMTELAEKFSVALMGSIIVSQNGNNFNRMIFAKPDGEIEFYDKRHLFRMGEENNHYTGGKQRKIFNFLGWRICPQICYDLRFPVWSRNRNDYDLLVYVASWPKARRNVWRTLATARAMENQSYVAIANRVGVDGMNLEYSGDSMIIDYKGDIIAEAVLGESSVVNAIIDKQQLIEFKDKFPTWMDADVFTLD